jgi:hypothetical protein
MKKQTRPSIIVFACLIFAPATFAESTVFVTRDANGNPVFSDQAGGNAEEIKIQTPQTFEAPPTPRFEPSLPKELVEIGPAYEQLEIVSPENDSAMRDNAGNVTVRVAISPGLQPNHSLEILVDGQAKGGNKSGAPILLENLDRGTHVYQARIIEDESGETLQVSNSVTHTLQRISVLRRGS